MQWTRRSFLTACLAAAGAPAAAGQSARTDPEDWFPWEAVRRRLHDRFPDLRRRFVFEYYPWYSTAPVRHWDQWGRNPPTDLASNTVPLLGAYDSRSTPVIEQHARWIAESGVGVVDLSWWGPGSFSDRAVSKVMDVMAAHDIHVTFHLEPYAPERAERLPADVDFLLREYGERRRWDCFFLHRGADGAEGPVFKLFDTTLPERQTDCRGVVSDFPGYVPDGAWRRVTDQVRERLRGRFAAATLLSSGGDPERVRRSGFDGTADYSATTPPERWPGQALAATQAGGVFSFAVSPGWDEIERRHVEPDSCYAPRPFHPRTRALDWSAPADRELARRLAEQRIRDTLQMSVLLQTHPWFSSARAGFFLTYVTSFNEWHEGTSFEPMKDAAALTPAERAVGYHNPQDGRYRLNRLKELLARLLQQPPAGGAERSRRPPSGRAAG